MTKNSKFNLNNLGWIIFVLFLGLNIFSVYNNFSKGMIYRSLPFRLNKGKAVAFQDSTLAKLLKNAEITKIDGLKIDPEYIDDKDNSSIDFGINFNSYEAETTPENFSSQLALHILHKKEIQLSYNENEVNRNIFINTKLQVDKTKLIGGIINIFFFLFIFFNSFLLLKYSLAKENILIIFFLLFLASPNNWGSTPASQILELLTSAMAGPLFYHYIIKKIDQKKSPKYIYFISILLVPVVYFSNIFISSKFNLIPYLWSVSWIFTAFIILWKAYRKTASIDLKRLMNAFSGIFIALISSLILGLSTFLLTLSTNGLEEVTIYSITSITLIIVLLLSFLIFFLGILWFFGAFTWSMLTGTALGVKIRSTMIFSIVGVVFVTVFGFIDYALGELLQTIFGRFMGSEFIAGIPATIGLLLFFNPVRRKVEHVVDKKLNTSDLNFLESTHTFTETLADEGVIEGFEEYICENLIARLPITKVALISYDENMHDFKFNEIRGSEVIENSAVKDTEKILVENKIHRISNPINNIQDSSSFALVIPIIYDNTDRWFIAFGKKKDGSNYGKRDEASLIKLTERIRLSLKFILAYEGMMNRKFQLQLQEKEEEISNLRLKLEKNCN